MKRSIRDEKGQVLLLALILLAVGALIINTLLGLMSTGLITGGVYEKKMDELYAADAGVEDAVWAIQHQVDIPTGCSADTTRSYTISDVNGKIVTYNITRANNVTLTYHVISTATGDGSGTKIDAYVTGTSIYGNYSGILNQVITCQGPIDYAPNQNITPPLGQPNGPVANYSGAWPDTEEEIALLEKFYLRDVDVVADKYNLSSMSVNGNVIRNSLYRDGSLTIESSADGSQLTLNGTFYITGKTIIDPNHTITINLNFNTLFVASCCGVVGCPEDPNGNDVALKIGGKCNIVGPGAIVVVGDIDFQPNIEVADPTKPVFLMSVFGTTKLLPQNNGYFYGGIAGSVEVQLQPNQTIAYPSGGFGPYNLNFPTGFQKLTYNIASWEVKPA